VGLLVHGDFTGTTFDVLVRAYEVNIVLGIFNLIPIPPLDGSKIMFAFLDQRLVWQWRPVLEQYGFLVLILLFFFPPGRSIGSQLLFPLIDGIYRILVGA
jgi:Zn-dependent protease